MDRKAHETDKAYLILFSSVLAIANKESNGTITILRQMKWTHVAPARSCKELAREKCFPFVVSSIETEQTFYCKTLVETNALVEQLNEGRKEGIRRITEKRNAKQKLVSSITKSSTSPLLEK